MSSMHEHMSHDEERELFLSVTIITASAEPQRRVDVPHT